MITFTQRRPYVFVQVAAAALLADLAASALKFAFGRDRPPATITEPKALVEVPSTSSFPSGHAATSFACALVLAHAEPRLRVPLFVLAVLIAFSRVYVGVHYPLDVVAGALLGLAVATALRWLPRALPRSRRSPRPG